MMQSIQIYENQFIGSFIYSMGVIAGQRGLPVNDSINLFQQTPGDRIIGDLFSEWQGRNFIVEFKRNIDGLRTEIKKPMRHKLLSILNSAEWVKAKNVSEKCHFISYGSEKGNSELELRFLCYNMLNRDIKNDTHWKMNVFLDQILDGELGVNEKQIKNYFSFLQRIENTEKTSVGGIVVNISKGGKATFLRFDDLFFLEKRIETEKELLIRAEKELEMAKRKEHGISLGM